VLATAKDAFLINLTSLGRSRKLDEKLTAILTQEDCTYVGYGFVQDMVLLGYHYPGMKFYQKIDNYVDIMNEAQYYFALKERPIINTVV
jgi:uncharacterized protein (DUF1919 family)